MCVGPGGRGRGGVRVAGKAGNDGEPLLPEPHSPLGRQEVRPGALGGSGRSRVRGRRKEPLKWGGGQPLRS